jgi:F-type H+-transporting ATPase subunit delta
MTPSGDWNGTMSVFRVARRYAEAAYGLAEEQQLGNRFAEDLALLQETMRSSREFVAFLRSPVISKDRKRSTLSELFKSRLSGFTFGFLNLLVDKGREDVLHDIVLEFFRLRDERQGLVVLDVRSATEMDENQQKTMVKRFEAVTGKKMRAAFRVDRELKGGFVARVGDTVYDGSLLRQLELLRERFAEGVLNN